MLEYDEWVVPGEVEYAEKKRRKSRISFKNIMRTMNIPVYTGKLICVSSSQSMLQEYLESNTHGICGWIMMSRMKC